MIRIVTATLLLLQLTACSNSTQHKAPVDTEGEAPVITQRDSTNPGYGLDTSYRVSTTHMPYRVTGFFNEDNVLDTALLVRHSTTAKDALLIIHGGTNKTILLRNGKDVGFDFDDFNWVGQFETIAKGTIIWNNVEDGEIVGEDQVSADKKIPLQTDAIFVHEDEWGGGGIIYLKKEKYVWVQQD